MQRTFVTMVSVLVLGALTGCADGIYQQPYATQQPPTLTQMQGECFSNFKQFNAQTNCIRNAIAATGITPDSGIQEYLLLMQSLQEKVERKTMSASDARLKLASKLSELRAQQQNEAVIQEQLANQRAAQNAEVLRQFQSQYKPPVLEVPQPSYALPRTVQTNCATIGNQVHCASQ